FRATPQWFIGMEHAGLRAHALRDIKGVAWTPAWGEQRISGMIESRPDWCISRQRTWGVPIPLFVHKRTGERHPRTQELIEAAAERVARGGIDAWFALEPQERPGGDAEHDAGVSGGMGGGGGSGMWLECAGAGRPEGRAPVGPCREGSDQPGGWLHSSTGALTSGRSAPTHSN